MRYMCFDLKTKTQVQILDPNLWSFECLCFDQTAYFWCNGLSYRFKIQEALEATILKPENLDAPKTVFEEYDELR